jgi:hypothetical protein
VVIAAGVASLALGALTAVGQGQLPALLSPLANSVGAWSLVAFLLASTAPSMLSAAVCGTVCLAGLLAGYVLTDEVRGLPSGTALVLFWGTAAVLGGPALGLAGHCLRRRRNQAAAWGAGLMSGVLIGEGAYGLRYIAATTPAPYWWASIALGLMMLVACVIMRLHELSTRSTAVLTSAATAAVFLLAYPVAGTVLGRL